MKSHRASRRGIEVLCVALGVISVTRVSGAANVSPTFTPPVVNMPFAGQLSSKFQIDDENPESTVPTHAERDKSPLEYGYYIQDLLARAVDAEKAQNYEGALRYYRALVKAVPERARSWGKLCETYAIVNDHERAAAACGTALMRPGVEVQDYVRFVHETIEGADAKGVALSAQQRTQLNDVLVHLDGQPNMQIIASHLRCQVGVKEGDPRLLETCTSVLGRLAPDDPKTAVFQWTLAVQRGQRDRAAELLKRLKKLGMPQENLERMEAVTFPGGQRGGWQLWLLMGFVVLTAGSALIVGLRRRRALAS
jgi:hypothetical protein